MKVLAEITYLNQETKVNKQGDSYELGLFMQGVQTIQFKIPPHLKKAFSPGEVYNAELDYDVRWKQLKLVDIK